MVAIMVTMILMIVISLIVLGFAQISRRNQRQTLDRQLSTQAFYAAETGINDVVDLIKGAGGVVPDKPDCASNGGGFYALDPVIDATSNVAYTCLTVDPSPDSLVYSDISQNSSTVVPIIATSGTISRIVLVWQAIGKNLPSVTNCPSTSVATNFTDTGSWGCKFGVLRFDLVPTAGSLNMSTLQANTMTSFVVPLRPGGTETANPIPHTTGGGNNRLGVACSETSCSLTIDNLNQAQYYMRVGSIYRDVSLRLEAFDAGGSRLSLQGAQAVVDSTGKAQDVLRRIQVRIPLNGSSGNQYGDFAIQSNEAICKRFAVMSGLFMNDAQNAVSGVETTTANPMCRP